LTPLHADAVGAELHEGGIDGADQVDGQHIGAVDGDQPVDLEASARRRRGPSRALVAEGGEDSQRTLAGRARDEDLDLLGRPRDGVHGDGEAARQRVGHPRPVEGLDDPAELGVERQHPREAYHGAIVSAARRPQGLGRAKGESMNLALVLLSLLVLGATAGPVPAGAQAKPVVWDLPHVAAPTYYHTMNLNAFATKVKE